MKNISTWPCLILSMLVFQSCIGSGKINIGKSVREEVTALSVAPAVAIEGHNVTFTVSLNRALETSASVEYETLDGDAIGGVNFTAASGSLTFAPGETLKTISVATIGDFNEVCGPDRVFTLMLRNATNVTIGTAVASGTITDPDLPTISVANASVTEGGTLNFVVTLTEPCPTKDVSFNWSSSSGTTAHIISRGDSGTSLSIQTSDDTIYEGTQTLTVTLSDVENASVTSGSAVGTILDNDPVPTVNFTAAAQSVVEGAPTAVVSVSLSNPSYLAITVPFTLSGSASGTGTDYTVTASEVVIAPGATTGSVSVSLVDDLISEGNETIILTMGNPTNAVRGTTIAHTITIPVSDSAVVANVTSAASNATITSGNLDVQVYFTSAVTVSGTPVLNLNTTPARFATYFSGSGTNLIVFRYAVQSGDTSTDLDYVSTSAIALAGGTVVDSASLVNVDLTLPVPGASGSLGANKNFLIDSPPISQASTPTIAADTFYSAGELFYISVPFSDAVTVSGTTYVTLTIGGVSKTAYYASGSGTNTLVFRYEIQSSDKGALVVSSSIDRTYGSVKNSSNVDANVSFTPPNTSSLYVDGTSVNLSFSSPSEVVEGNGMNQTFTLTLSSALAMDVTLPISLRGAATKGVDYDFAATSVVIPAGQLSAFVSFDVLDDSIDESAEDIHIIVGRPLEKSNVVIAELSGAVIPIRDDDLAKNWISVKTGNSHTCGIRSNGAVKCWGVNWGGQLGNGTKIDSINPILVDAGESYKQIGVGSGHTCGITTGNVLKCWGYNYYGQIGDGTGTDATLPVIIDAGVSYKFIAVGEDWNCGITSSDEVKCWGYNGSGQLGDNSTTRRYAPVLVDSGVTYKSLSAGSAHTCGITTADVLKCWGSNYYWALGNSSSTSSSVPVVADSGVLYKEVVAGHNHTCGITTSDVLKCWGDNWAKQAGLTNTTTYSPTVYDPGVSYKSLGIGYMSTCGITTSNVLKCWGYNVSRVAGNGYGSDVESPGVMVDSGTSYASVDSSMSSTCGITSSGLLKCWGSGTSGQLATKIVEKFVVPTENTPGETFKLVSSGSYSNHNCLITSSNVLKCAGLNNQGQVGDGSKFVRDTFVVVDPGVTYKDVSLGVEHTCGITMSGVLKCWGANGKSQVGTASNSRSVPAVVDPGVSYKSVSAGNWHTCAVTTDDKLKCWGENYWGQIGDGTFTTRQLPYVVDSGVSYRSVSSGALLTCGITTTDVLKCWGYRIGNNTGSNIPNPTIINPGTSYKLAAAGMYHTCALKTDGGAQCWGQSTSGQVGDGTTITPYVPVNIDSGITYKTLSAASGQTCGITTADRVRCWGSNAEGIVGDGTSTQRPSPVFTASSSSYKSISTGNLISCGIDFDDKLFCWGTNRTGQFGNTFAKFFPLPAADF